MALASPTTLDLYTEAVNQNLPGVSDTVASATDKGLGEILTRYLSAAMVLAALLLLLYLLWGGLDWIMAGGDKGKVEKARDKITQGVIGIVVMATSLAIFLTVQSFLGIDIIRFKSSGTSTTKATSTGRSSSGSDSRSSWWPFGKQPITP